MFSSFVAYCATVMALLPLGSCLAESPDDRIPLEWRSGMAQNWDSTEIRYSLNWGDGKMSDQRIWTLDQIMEGEGTINVCMRWGANRTLAEAERYHIEDVYRMQFNEWFSWLRCWDGFPFRKVKINVVAWAAYDETQLEGSTDDIDVHTGILDDRYGLPTCNPGCSRDLHQDGNYTDCPGGRDHRFDQYLVIDTTWGDYVMGAASGQGITLSQYGWETAWSQGKRLSLIVHEMGLTFGLHDYLDTGLNKTYSLCSVFWLPPNAPSKFVMLPGSGGLDMADELTEMEGWMLRHFWSRFSRLRGWQNDSVTWPEPLHCDVLETDP